MARKIETTAERLGARVIGQVPDTGVGAFGAARLAKLVASLQERLEPSAGLRPGRPTDPSWVHHAKVLMSEETRRKLDRLAEHASTPRRRVSRMQIAARLLEEAVARYPLE
jgi:hypothetical protein